MITSAQFLETFNDLWGRLIRSVTDPSVPPQTVRKWEVEALAYVNESFASSPQLTRYPDIDRIKYEVDVELTATNALRTKRHQGLRDQSITPEELGARLDLLQEKITLVQKMAMERMHPNDALFFYAFEDELAFIARERRAAKAGCYIATAVYGSYDAAPVLVLRKFRDRQLATTAFGRALIRAYYAVGPSLARRFGPGSMLSRAGKVVLDRVVEHLRRRGYTS